MENLLFSPIPLDLLKSEITDSIKVELSRLLKSATSEKSAEELITRKDAAKLLRVSLPTVLHWTKTGKIIGYRIGSRIRYKRSEIEKSLVTIQVKSRIDED